MSMVNASGLTLLEYTTVLEEGVLGEVELYFCDEGATYLQLWEDEGDMTYTLIWEHLLKPGFTNGYKSRVSQYKYTK